MGNTRYDFRGTAETIAGYVISIVCIKILLFFYVLPALMQLSGETQTWGQILLWGLLIAATPLIGGIALLSAHAWHRYQAAQHP